MVSKKKRKRFHEHIEALLIILILLANTSEILGFLPLFFRIFFKFLAFMVFTYTFYHLSFMRILFGKKRDLHISRKTNWVKNKHLDVLIIMTFLLMGMGDILLSFFYSEYVHHQTIADSVLGTMLYNAMVGLSNINYLFFIFGGILVIILALFLGFFIHFEKPSFLSIVHEDKYPHKVHKKLQRAATVFISLMIMFIVVFRIYMQIFVLILDVPFVLGIFFYIIMYVKNKRHRIYHPTRLIYKAGSLLEKIYEGIIELVHQKSKIRYFFSFMIVLNLLNDFIIYAFPLLLGWENELIPNHSSSSISSLITMHPGNPYMFLNAMILVFMTIITIMTYLLGPIYVWYKSYRHENIIPEKSQLGVILSSLVVFHIGSTIILTAIGAGSGRANAYETIGVIFTFIIDRMNFLSIYLLLFVLGFVIIWGFSYLFHLKRVLGAVTIVPIAIFITQYVYAFLVSTVAYYRRYLLFLWESHLYFRTFMFGSFFICMIAILLLGYFFSMLDMKYAIKKIR